MTKHVLILLDLPYRRAKDQPMSIGHASLLAALAQFSNIETHSIVCSNPNLDDVDQIAESVMEDAASFGSDQVIWLGIGVYLWNDQVVRRLLRLLRQRDFEGRIVLGGPQISFLEEGRPEREYPEADIFLCGSAEVSLPMTILGNAIPHGVHSPCLTTLPSPILTGILPLNPHGFAHLETQRGCPFACSFCQHRSPTARKRPEHFSWERLRSEIHMMVRAGIADIKIVDPIFHHNPLAVDILNEFKSLRYSGKLACEARFETITDAFLDACAGLDITLEFGLQTVIEQEWKAINRPNNLAKIDATISDLHRRRIPFSTSIIYGLPLQTLESFKETVAFCKSREIPDIQAFPLCVYPGTELEKQQKQWGLEVELREGMPEVVQTNMMSRSDNERMREIAKTLRTES